jgi:hypothetical protein
VFEQYRRELAAVMMPPLLQGYYLLYTGRGYHIFDRPALARTTLERAIAHANAHRLNQILIEAEQLLLDVRTGRELPMAAATTSLSEDTRAVADAIRELRTLAGVSG